MTFRPVTIEDTRVVTHEAATSNEPDPIANLRWYLKRVCAPGAPLLHDLDALESRLATVEAERAALAADADRLSWLQHIAQVSRYGVAIAPVGATRLALWEPLDGEIPDGWCLARSAFSLRDAIDEGRAQEDARRPPTPGDTP